MGSGTQLQAWQQLSGATGNTGTGVTLMIVVSPSAGSKTYNVGLSASAGTANMEAGATYPAFILVEAV